MTTSGSDRTIQIGVEVDSSQAAQGLTKISQAAQRTAADVSQAGKLAGEGIAKIGDGAPAAEQKITRSAQAIINSIERTTAALKSGGAQSAEYYQTLANQRGVNAAVLEPYIQKLKQAEAAQLAASQSLKGMGMSAQATAAAMRTVPAQFTDIVTSLQGGQSPLTVLFQQGGQLKDQFGGVGAAARALGGYVLGLVNPFTVAAAAGIALAVAYEKGSGESRAFERALIVSGNQAGVTGAQLAAMAASVDKVAGTQARAAEVLTLLASSGDVGSTSFERFTIAAIAFEKAGGQAAEETVKAFQELGKEPLKAALKLNEAQGFLTASVYEQIKALESQGRTLEAAKVAQDAYAAALEQRTPAMQAQLGTLERGWLAVKNATAEAVDKMLSIGRARSPVEQAREDLARLQENQAGARSDNKARYQPAIDALSRQLLMLDKVAAAENERAKSKAEEIRLVKEKAEWDKRGDEYLEKKDKRDKELIAEAVKGRELINKGLLTEVELKDRLIGITEKYKEKEKKGTGRKPNEFAGEQEFAKLWAADFKKMREEAVKAEASMLGLSKAQEKLLLFLKSDEYQRASDPMRELVLEQAYAAIAFEQTEEAANAQAKALKEVEKANTDYVESLQKDAAAAGKRLGQLQEENAAAIIAAQANISLAEAIEQVAIARLQEQQAVEMSFGNEAAVQAIQNEIDARRELQKEIRTKDTRKADEEAAKDAKKEAEAAAKEWEKSAQKIEDSITDALMRGFESGKGFAETLRDTVVNMFKTLILRPVVSAIVSPIAQGIAGMVAPTAASAGTSMLGSAASSAAGSALFGGTSLGALGSAFGEGFMATLGGSTISGGTAAGLLAGGAAPGTGIAGTLGAAAPYALAASAVLAALGAFRTTKTVGGGLQGTLGEGDITGYDLQRKSGYLFGGPDYSIRETGVAAQSATLQKAYIDMRAASVGMADALGLGSDAIKNFTTRLGSDLIHPDTGGLGLKLDGLKPEEVEAKVAAAMKAANDAIAAEVLGVKTTIVTTTTKMVEEAVGPLDEWGQATDKTFKEISESITSTNVTARKDLLPWMQRLVDLGGPTAATLQKLYTYSDELLTVAGTSRDALVKTYTEGLMSGDPQKAGQAVADTLVASIEQTMLGSAASQIFDIINRGIVTPVIDAMLTGKTITEALSQASIDATIKKAQDQAAVLSTLFNDERFQSILAGLKTGLGQVLGGVGQTLNYQPKYQPPPAAKDVGDEAQKAAEEALKKWQEVTDALKEEGASLAIDLLRAQGNETAAVAAERARAIVGLDEYQVGLYDSNQALKAQIDLISKNKQAMLDFWGAADAAAESLLSGEALRKYRVGRIADNPELQKLGLSSDVLDAQTPSRIRELVLSFVALPDVATETKTAVLGAAAALLDLSDAAKQTADDQKTAALDLLRDNINAIIGEAASQSDASLSALAEQTSKQKETLGKAKDAAKTLKDEVKSVFDLLDDSIKGLYDQVDASRESEARKARAFISQSLAAARATGVLPEQKALSDAISAAKSGMDAAVYQSQSESDFARLVLAGELSALQDISGTQLTEAERQVKLAEDQIAALDLQLEAAREQLDVLRGIDVSIKSVPDALAAFTAAFAAEKNARDLVTANNVAVGTGSAIFNQGTGTGLVQSGDLFDVANVKQKAIEAINAGKTALELYAIGKQSGFTIKQLEGIFGSPSGSLEDEARKLGLPIFHNGTPFVPETGYALLQRGEAVISAGQNANNFDKMTQAINKLVLQNAELSARLEALQASAAKTADLLDQVSDGGNALRTEVMA